MKKLILTSVVILCSGFTTVHAQGFIGAEVTNNGVGLNAGAVLNDKVQFKLGWNSSPSRSLKIPSIFYCSSGYQFNINKVSITPFIGIAVNVVGVIDSVDHTMWSENKTVLFTSLEVGRSFDFGRYYIFVNHAKSYVYGIGIKFNILLTSL